MNKKNKIIPLISFIVAILSICLTVLAVIINHLPKENTIPDPKPIEPIPEPITKKEDIDISNVIFNDVEYTYDGDSKAIEVSNVPDTLNYEIKYYLDNNLVEEVINVGKYKATLEFSVKDDKLYNKPNNLEANLTINKKIINIDDLIITNEYIYDKEEKKIAISNLPEGINYNESYYDKYNNLVDPINSGVYRANINFEINNNNYDIEDELELILNIYSNLKYKEENDYISVLGFADGFEEKYINIPKTYNDKPITTISNNAFYESNVYEAILGNNVENISNQAFSNSNNLMSLTLGENIQTISNTSFNNCYRLKEIINLSGIILNNNSNLKKYSKDIYDSLIYESKIIYGNNSLIYYSENDELSLINYVGNDKLLTISSKYNDKFIIKIDDYALYNLNLDSIVLNSGLKEIGKYSLSKNDIKTINLPNTLIILDDYSLANSNNIEEIVLQQSITNIGVGAFKDCVNLKNINLNTSSIDSISNELFYGCENLENITLSSIVKKIGNNSFYGTSKLNSLDISKIEELDDYAFANSGIKEITLPNGIKDIPDYLFYNSNLENIIIPSTVKSIGEYAFEDCHDLSTVTFNEGLEEIKKEAFKNTKISSITLPNSLTTIGEKAFSSIDGLVEINLSNAITVLPAFVFQYAQIENIIIPSNVTKIETGAFLGCSSLKNIIIPENVTEIGANIFDRCSDLKKVEIKGKISRITTAMFSDCGSIDELILPATLGTIVEYAFVNSNENIKIYSYANNINIGENNDITNSNIYYYKENLDSVTEVGQFWTIDNGEIKTKINN